MILWVTLLIDASHKHWIWGTAVTGVAATGFYVWLDKTTIGGVTGGSFWGLMYGLVGSLLMVYAGLLAAHRKLLKWAFVPRRSWWLRGHIWLGLLSGVLILCHSRRGFGGPFEQVLWAVFALTLLTGMGCVVLQHFLPRSMTNRIGAEAPYEQIPYLCRTLRRHSDALVLSHCGPEENSAEAQESAGHPQLDAAAKKLLRDWYDGQVRPFLLDVFDRTSPLAEPGRRRQLFALWLTAPGLAPVRGALSQLEELCEQRRQLGEQERLHLWLHGLLIVHVPLTLALLILGITHAVMALYY